MENRHSLVAGNWKLNGSRSSVVALADAVARGVANVGTEVLLCPSFVHLADVLGVVGNTPVRLGAQDCAAYESGAYTGESAAVMLAEFGCEYVIVGHSERRQIFRESNEYIAEKFLAARNADLTPILCVGETLEERQSGNVMAVIDRQLDAVVNSTLPGGADTKDDGDSSGNGWKIFQNAVIAYEPVWAIGTGETASPAQAQEVHAMIRQKIAEQDAELAARIRLLYGGSVKPGNAGELFSQPDIDGGLIGGAALKAEDFIAICEAAA